MSPEATAKTIFEIGKDNPPSPNIYIKSMSVKRVSDTGLELSVEIEKMREGKSIGAKSLSKKFKLDALFDSSNKMVQCYSQMDNARNSARELACRDLCDTCWDATSQSCTLDVEFKKQLVRDALEAWGGVPVYVEGNIVEEKTCAECDKDGCNPCPVGWVESNRGCTTGLTCGLKPRWRNCTAVCKKYNLNGGEALGDIYNL